MHNKYKNNSRRSLKHFSTRKFIFRFFSNVKGFEFLSSNYTVVVVPVACLYWIGFPVLRFLGFSGLFLSFFFFVRTVSKSGSR